MKPLDQTVVHKSRLKKVLLSFSQTNKTKETGTYIQNGDQFFYKIATREAIQNEVNFIRENGNAYPSAKIVDVVFLERYGIVLFNFINTKKDCGYNFLRNKNIDITDKNKAISRFYERYISTVSANYIKTRIIDYPASVFFEERVSSRLPNFFGDKWNEVLRFSNIQKAVIFLEKERLTGRQSILSYTHGDLHDINFSYDWVFWDFEVAGLNPILCDLSCILWYTIFQEDYILPVSNQYFITSNTGLFPTVLAAELKDHRIEALKAVASKFEQHFIDLNCDFSSEISWRLFCRILLIENIQSYPEFINRCIDDVCKEIFKYMEDGQTTISGLISNMYLIAEELENQRKIIED